MNDDDNGSVNVLVIHILLMGFVAALILFTACLVLWVLT